MKSCIPTNLRASITEKIVEHAGFADDMLYDESETLDMYQCYQMLAEPTDMNWIDAYNQDPSKRIMMSTLSCDTKTIWTKDQLDSIELEYRLNLRTHFISFLYNRMAVYKPVFKNVKYVGLIIVPYSLQRIIFSHYHSGPSGGYMGEYKTLFRIRMQFFGLVYVKTSTTG